MRGKRTVQELDGQDEEQVDGMTGQKGDDVGEEERRMDQRPQTRQWMGYYQLHSCTICLVLIINLARWARTSDFLPTGS